MAILKCKMCGGDLNLIEGASVAECEFCGTAQTVPNVDNEKKLTLFTRANRLRAACEFDKAAGIYENIVAEFTEEAEAYWGLILCKYGIEYVDDPATGKKIPTCHRSSFDCVLDDNNFEMVMEYADAMARRVYREEAKAIEELRKGIVEVSAKEEPYDIFICYKETAPDGQRTLDSVLAQDIYDALTEKGYRVFFSRITLEDKLGVEYEPYIFAALNSAKVMLAVGTDYEYYNAVWVKNEWSRFLQVMTKDKNKYLIPCFKGIDAYDMPKEFAKLQAQDLGKVGAMQDLLRGIEKLLPSKQKAVESYAVPVQVVNGFNASDLLRKASIHLEEGRWENVQETCNQIIAADPENAWVYLYQLANERHLRNVEQLGEGTASLRGNPYFEKALKYADQSLKEKLLLWANRAEENSSRAEEAYGVQMLRAKKLKKLFSGGKNHTAMVQIDGTVLARGKNEFGECNVQHWHDVVQIVCGDNHTVGLCADGTVLSCGNNEFGQCDVESWRDIVDIDCDGKHTLGLCADGTVVACGKTGNGECDVSGWRDIEAIACGFHHSVGYRKDGTWITTGSNRFGQCNVTETKNIADFGCSNVQTVCLHKNGLVSAYGNTEDNRIEVNAWQDIISVAMGSHHTVGLKADGTVVACGSDKQSRVSGTKGWKDIVAISCGNWHTMGVKSDGTIVVCGDTDYGKNEIRGQKLFDDIETFEEARREAREKRLAKSLEGDSKIRLAKYGLERSSNMCAGGQQHVVAITKDGYAVACGDNSKGQCNVQNWKDIWAVSCGDFHTVGLLGNGTVIACGDNSKGQCDVQGWKDIVAIRCGNHHTVGLKKDGTVVACGDNEFGQCNITEWSDIKELAAGWCHTVGLKKDGTVIACGDNSHTQCDVEKWNNIISITANNIHTVGIQKGYSVVACGNNEHGQCNVSQWRDVISVACGSHHTLGLKIDGSVISCGHNGSDRISGTKSWAPVAQVACGQWFSMGLRSDGSILMCGELDNGKDRATRWKYALNTTEEKERRVNAAHNRTLREQLGKNWTKYVSESGFLAVQPSGKVTVCSDDAESLVEKVNNWVDIASIKSDFSSVFGIRKNGTVAYCGKNKNGSGNVEYWDGIVDIAYVSSYANNVHTVGLRYDGTVVACGKNNKGQCDVSSWTNIVAVKCAEDCTVGIRADGTVAICGNHYCNTEVKKWTNIEDVAITADNIFGLRKDGTVAVSGFGKVKQAAEWKNIKAICAANSHLVGLRNDGTVLAVGNKESLYGERNVEKWRNVIAIGAGDHYTLGLQKDGTVLFVGDDLSWTGNGTNLKASSIRDVVAISDTGTLLKANGCIYRRSYESAYKTGWRTYTNMDELCKPSWQELPTDPAEIARIRGEMDTLRRNRIAAGLCQHCGSSEFKGLFSKHCAVCEMPKDEK